MKDTLVHGLDMVNGKCAFFPPTIRTGVFDLIAITKLFRKYKVCILLSSYQILTLSKKDNTPIIMPTTHLRPSICT